MALLALGRAKPSNDPPCWVVRGDLGLCAVVVPVGRWFAAVSILLDALVEAASVQEPFPTDRGASIAVLSNGFARAALLFQDLQDKSPDLRGVGAAAVALLFGRDHVAVAHMGDCRAYLFRDGSVAHRTEDHLLPGVPRIVVRMFGMGPEVEPELQTWDLRRGDTCLLTAEIHAVLSDEVITACATGSIATEDEIMRKLCSLAADAGARDYIVSVLARI